MNRCSPGAHAKARQLVAAIGVFAATLQPPAASATPVLSVVGGSQVGNGVSVSVTASNLVDLTSFQFDVGYDALVLQLVSFTDAATDFQAAALASGGALAGLTGIPAAGNLFGAADAMSGALSGLAPSGSLLTLDFLVLSSGTSQVRLSNIFLIDDGTLIDSTGVATTGGAVVGSIPEPGTLLMVLLALAVGCGVRRSRSFGRKSNSTETMRSAPCRS